MIEPTQRVVEVSTSAAKVRIGNALPFVLIAGPCSIEGRDHALRVAETIGAACADLGIQWVYKSSWDKANRTSATAPRGVGMEVGLEILDAVRREIGCPVLTDVHEPGQCARVAEVVDVLQVPAFLCRQTDMLMAAGSTGRPVHLKKGQFCAPEDMEHAAAKAGGWGAPVLLGERGTTFGYRNLVVDFRSLPTMKRTGWPVVFDATHSVQLPSAGPGMSGGQPEFIEPLARAAVAVGVAAVFLEVHEEPERAPSDGACMLRLDKLHGLLRTLKRLDEVAKAA